MGNSNTESNEETSSNEHLDVDTNGLHDNSDDHDGATRDDTSTSTSDIGNIWSNWEGDDRANGHNSIEQTTS